MPTRGPIGMRTCVICMIARGITMLVAAIGGSLCRACVAVASQFD